ncbi:MAG: recombinase family protein [Patescibacteria group bacterium]
MYGETILAKKYVIYARKSTDEPGKQLRSTEDQVAECKELAERLGLNVPEKPIIEKQTAKIPGVRPLFTKLLKRIGAGEVDGIIAWHPDRLARNMKEGGEIIHLIDTGKLVDLKFVSHPFTNDPSGKMLLGIAFALSKEYSDRLSVNVQRGNKRNLMEGKGSGHFKHGYFRDEEGFQRPDAKTFGLIKEAWHMRLKDTSYEKIVAWLNGQGYKRKIKKEKTKMARYQAMSEAKLSNVFADPMYFGQLNQGGEKINLCELYDFVPMVSEQEYFEVQRLNSRGRERVRENMKHVYPLRGHIFCSACETLCNPGASRSRNNERYLYYRCNNKQCRLYGKGIRAKIVFAGIEKAFREDLNLTHKQYQEYTGAFRQRQIDRRTARKTEMDRLQGTLKHAESEHSRLSDEFMQNSAHMTEKMRTKRLGEISRLEKDQETLEGQIKELKQDELTDLLNYDQLLNLWKKADLYWRNADHVQKSEIARLFILNLATNFKNVVKVRLRPEFSKGKDTLLVQDGGLAWT